MAGWITSALLLMLLVVREWRQKCLKLPGGEIVKLKGKVEDCNRKEHNE
jgi:hypothetical protein